MQKIINKEKAITLISLVVTIIILLILAGITISQLAGNGIFEKAKEAKEKYKIAQKDEENVLNEYSTIIDSDRDFEISNLQLDYTNKVDIKTYTSNNNKYTVPSTGIIITSATGRDNASGNSKMNIGGISLPLCGDGSSSAYDISSYSQIVTKSVEIYFDLKGNTSLDNAYFIPFK